MKRARDAGQSLVEFALVVPIFLILVFGVVDGVRAVFAYNTIANASREGARYAMVHGSNSSSAVGPGNTSALTVYVQKYTDGLGASSVTITPTWPGGSNDAGGKVKVDVQYQWKPMFSSLLHTGPLTLDASSTMVIVN